MVYRFDVNGFDIGYEYNDVGSVTKVIYPGVGKEVTYTYDQLNRIKTVTPWTGQVATYTYDSAGHLVSVNNFNGIKSSFKYDKADRVIAIKNQRSDSSILTSYDYTLDGNGNKTKIAKNEPQSLTLGVSDTPFTYNFEKNRLLTAGGSTFSYDAEGQLSGKNTDTFTFDYDHRLTAINGASTVQFTYDARDARVKAVRNGVETKYIYDAGGNLLAEADSAGVIQQYYIYGAGLLASITPTDDVYTYHYNGNGNTIAITDQTQLIVNSYAYTPYGQITTEVENITNPFKFAGQFGIMHESGDIYYMRARYYDASVGRFISEDPSGFVDGANLFAYVRGNPINRIDSDGRDSFIIAQLGHEMIAIDDPNVPGGLIIFDFYPTNLGDGIISPAQATVGERKLAANEGLFFELGAIEVPGTRRKQNRTQDVFTVNRARQLQKAALTGDLKYRLAISDLNCIGFCVAVQLGKEKKQ